jgi:hypothetical protein
MTAHALLSASGAHRWMNCPPSARLETQYPDTGSAYAAEGTLAHRLAELTLRFRLQRLDAETYQKRRAPLEKDPQFSREMLGHASDYANFVLEKFAEAKAAFSEAEVRIEERVDFSAVVSEGFGTADAVIISDKYLEVIDLKYGKGVPVSAKGNPQMRLYGYGTLHLYEWLYDFEEVRMTIYQPRIDSVSEETLTVPELTGWVAGIHDVAHLAYEGKGSYASGSWCRFCRAAGDCRARAEAALHQAQEDFTGDPAPAESPNPARLTPTEVATLLPRAAKYAAWYTALTGYAQDRAVNHGVRYPGYKLVEGRSIRKIADEKAAEAAFKAAGFKPAQYITKKLKGITDLEKLLGKEQKSLLEPYIIKPPGKPALVPESDSRPEINTADVFKED